MSLKGAWLHHVTHFKFWTPPSISKERLKLELSKFGTPVGYIKSYETNKNHPQSGVVMVT